MEMLERNLVNMAPAPVFVYVTRSLAGNETLRYHLQRLGVYYRVAVPPAEPLEVGDEPLFGNSRERRAWWMQESVDYTATLGYCYTEGKATVSVVLQDDISINHMFMPAIRQAPVRTALVSLFTQWPTSKKGTLTYQVILPDKNGPIKYWWSALGGTGCVAMVYNRDLLRSLQAYMEDAKFCRPVDYIVHGYAVEQAGLQFVTMVPNPVQHEGIHSTRSGAIPKITARSSSFSYDYELDTVA